MRTRTEYRVARDHAITTAAGAPFAVGETAAGVDPSDPHDANLIEEGRLIPIQPPPESAPAAGSGEKTKEQN